MLYKLLSPEVTSFFWARVLLKHYKEYNLDLAVPFRFDWAHSQEGKVDIIRHNTMKPNRVTPK